MTTEYVFDYDRTLSATSGTDTTFYLYGVGGVIGELTDDWTYGLQDGANTQRQLTDELGEVVLVSSYTPWGDIISVQGDGGFTFGYFGSMMDAATGLLYIGNGQYYDPATGRFINGGNQMNNLPVMVDPAGMFLAPLSLLPLMFSGKKKKNNHQLELLLILMVVSASLGMSLTTLNGTTEPPVTTPVSSPAIPPSGKSTANPATVNQAISQPNDAAIQSPAMVCNDIPLDDDFWENLKYFYMGLGHQFLDNATFGISTRLLFNDHRLDELMLNENDAFYYGRWVGQIATTAFSANRIAKGILKVIASGVSLTITLPVLAAGAGPSGGGIFIPGSIAVSGEVVLAGVGVLEAGYGVAVAAYAAGNGPGFTPPKQPMLNSSGKPYPEVIDPRTGEPIPEPPSDLKVVDKELRVEWDSGPDRYKFIKEWYDRGYKTPKGGWEEYEIHHIIPQRYGGTNDYARNFL